MISVFAVTLKMKGYLLNTLDTYKYSLLLNWKVCGEVLPWGIRYI